MVMRGDASGELWQLKITLISIAVPPGDPRYQQSTGCETICGPAPVKVEDQEVVVSAIR